MAKYIQCTECSTLTKQPCVKCAECSKALGPRPKADFAIHIFKSGWYEHIALDPIYVKNRKQLLHETRSRGETSDYAEQ